MPGTAAEVTEPAKMKSRRVWDGLDGIFCSECLKRNMGHTGNQQHEQDNNARPSGRIAEVN